MRPCATCCAPMGWRSAPATSVIASPRSRSSTNSKVWARANELVARVHPRGARPRAWRRAGAVGILLHGARPRAGRRTDRALHLAARHLHRRSGGRPAQRELWQRARVDHRSGGAAGRAARHGARLGCRRHPRQPAARAWPGLPRRRAASPHADLQRLGRAPLRLDDAGRVVQPHGPKRLQPLPRSRRSGTRGGRAQPRPCHRAARGLRAVPFLHAEDAPRRVRGRKRRQGGGTTRAALESRARDRQSAGRVGHRGVAKRDPGRRRAGHRRSARHVRGFHRHRLPRHRRRRCRTARGGGDGPAQQDGPRGRHRARRRDPDRPVRRAGAGAGELFRRAAAARAGIHPGGDRRDLHGRPDRRAGGGRRTLELVQGRAADRRLPDHRADVLLHSSMKPVLDPIDRVSEVIFGVLMAMTFIGALNVASAGREEARTVMIAALGCNIAWGLTDAIMYVVAMLTERSRARMLGEAPAEAPRLQVDDLRGALAVFLLVTVSTFPLVVPFLVFGELATALSASRLVALAMLFVGGWLLARYAGGNRWLAGFGMAAVGALLVGALIALGG